MFLEAHCQNINYEIISIKFCVYKYYSFHVIFFIKIAEADTKYSLYSQNDVKLSVI